MSEPTEAIEITIPNWIPHSVNEFLESHWAKAAKMKREDSLIVGTYFYQSPQAKGKRRVSITAFFPKSHRGRKPDPTNLEKSLLDGLKNCGMLVDDSEQWCEVMPTRFEKGERGTRIRLEDLP